MERTRSSSSSGGTNLQAKWWQFYTWFWLVFHGFSEFPILRLFSVWWRPWIVFHVHPTGDVVFSGGLKSPVWAFFILWHQREANKKHIVIINSNSFWLVRGAPEQISEVTSPNLNHIPSIAMFINAQSLIPVYPTEVKSTIIQGTTIPDRPPILEVSFGNQLVLVDIQWHESQTLVQTVAPIPAFASTSATAPMSVVQAMDWNSFQRTHNKKRNGVASC